MHNFELHLQKEFQVTCTTPPLPAALKQLDLRKIAWSNSLDILKQLAALGSLSWEGKKLIVDLFSKVPFSYVVKKDVQGRLELHGHVLLKQPIALAQCRFVAPCTPTWFIIDQQLKVISSDVSWLSLQKLPRLIDADELEELIEEAKFENAPQVKIEFEGAFVSDPLPMLKLTDRTGAFANLYMDYGQGKLVLYASQDTAKRNIIAENHWEKDLLETNYTKKIVDRSHYYCPLDKVGKSLAFLLELGWRVVDAKDQEVLLETRRQMEIKPSQERLALEGKIEFGSFAANLTQVIGAFNRREQFIDLGSGKIGLLSTSQDLATLAEEVEIVSNTPLLKRSQVALLEPSSWTIPASLKSLVEGVQSSETPSSDFKGTLRPYQQKGLAWLSTLYQTELHGILADEMGLGKTVQLLSFLSLRNPSARHLIIVPTSLLFNWEREIERFLPSLTHCRHHGPLRAKTSIELPKTGVIITSYNTLRADIELFKQIEWDCILLDEAQAVKNPDSKIAQSLYQLNSRFRIAMTGTIIENHAKELWAHFHFLMPGLLGDRTSFEQNLALTQVDSRYVRKIQKIIRPFILRRKKEEVAKDLPPLEEQVTFVEMSADQRLTYDSFLASTKQGLLKKVQLEGESKHRMQIFEALLRLRQIACHPLLVTQLLTDTVATSGKMEALMLDLETIREEGKKALIYSQFASMLHLIARELQQIDAPYCLLEGATLDRESQVKRFQEDPSVPFFLITLKAGGVGLNLTAADYVLLYDPWWHEAAEAQAIARAHRIGQEKPVIAKRYITIESVEEKMLSLKKAKSALFQNLLEGDLDSPTLSMEDLSFLMS